HIDHRHFERTLRPGPPRLRLSEGRYSRRSDASLRRLEVFRRRQPRLRPPKSRRALSLSVSSRRRLLGREIKRCRSGERRGKSPAPNPASLALGNVAHGSPQTLGAGRGLSPSDGGSARGRCEVGNGPRPPGADFSESGCLGMQPKAVVNSIYRLNTARDRAANNPHVRLGFNPTVLIGRPARRCVLSTRPPPSGGRAAGGGRRPPGSRRRRAISSAGGAPRPPVRQEGSGDGVARGLAPAKLYSAARLRRYRWAAGDTHLRAPPGPPRKGAVLDGPSASTLLSTGPTVSVRRPIKAKAAQGGTAHDTGAQGPRATPPPNRPALKHGPRSPTRAKSEGLPRQTPRRNESEGRRHAAEVGSARLERAGAPSPASAARRAQVEQERAMVPGRW
ncbi:hypothetical protein KOW79_011890, partial [Hemibagrus wyckioides]